MSRCTRLLLLLVTVGLLLAPATALADPLLPARPAGAPAYSGGVPLYDDPRFPPYVYTFEGNGNQKDSLTLVTVYFWTNQLLVTKAWLLKFSLRLAEYALQVDFLKPFLARTESTLSALSQMLWEGNSPLVMGALSLAGLWAILLYIWGRVRRVWASLGGTMLILIVGVMVITGGAGWTGTAHQISRELSGQVYTAVDGLTPRDSSGWGLLARSGDLLWRTLVYEPWVTGEFGSSTLGSTTYGQLDGSSFLLKDVETRHRICNPRTAVGNYCPWYGDEFLPRRMVIAGWTFLAALVVSGALAALAGGMILAQLALLFLLALSPVWLLVALWWPSRGRQILATLWLKALGALVLQVVLAVTLGLLLLLTLPVTTAFEGWMLQSVLLAALAVVALRYRTAWLEPIGAVRRWSMRRSGEAELASPAGRRLEGRAAAGGGAEAAEPLPVFATLSPTGGRTRVQTASPELLAAAEGPAAWQEPGQTEPRPAFFRTEMQVLRQQLQVREQVLSPEGPGGAEWSAPASNGTQWSPFSPSQATPLRERRTASSARGSDMTRIPLQRPKP